MPIDLAERVTYLQMIHLFTGLSEIEYQAVANSLREVVIPKGGELTRQGEQGDCLYLIWKGKATQMQAGDEGSRTILERGDYFGEEAVIRERHDWDATVTADEEVQVFILSRAFYVHLSKKINRLRTNFQTAIASKRMASNRKFTWLQDGETIQFIERKHPVILVQNLLLPVILLIAGILGLLASWYYSMWNPNLGSYWYLSLAGCIFAVAWGAWKTLDWSNDYYIVTDRRVVWLEKVIAIHESRHETPLSAVQRVYVESDLSGRLMDYGDLVIQTIVGSSLKCRNVSHPNQAAALIDQYWKKSKDSARKMDSADIQKALRIRLLDDEPDQSNTTGIIRNKEVETDPYQTQKKLANLFRLRFEQQATVTYRKHIIVLLQQTILPCLVIFILLIYLTIKLISPPTAFADKFGMDAGLFLLLWIVLMLASILWLVYQYVDWSNDIFQVTPDEIIDLDKTPLGQVRKDIAALENILTIENKRNGILELLFNYGTVFITIGGGREMAFENVFDPSAVQDDIERRRLEKINSREKESIQAERNRVADWFAAYYENEEQIRKESESRLSDKKNSGGDAVK